MEKKLNLTLFFGQFLLWLEDNNWVHKDPKTNEYCLTKEGEDELQAFGIDVSNAVNQKCENGKKDEEILDSVNQSKKEYSQIHLYTDGGSRGNQFAEGGKAAIGIIICDDNDEVISTHQQYLGKATNNQAEYTALITGLSLAKNYQAKEVTCISDSQLMINQLNGTYKIKDKTLQKMVMTVKELEGEFRLVRYVHQPRENRILKKADKLVNKVLDAKGV